MPDRDARAQLVTTRRPEEPQKRIEHGRRPPLLSSSDTELTLEPAGMVTLMSCARLFSNDNPHDIHVEIPFCQENSISLREIEADTPPSNTAVEYRLKEFHGSHVRRIF